MRPGHTWTLSLLGTPHSSPCHSLGWKARRVRDAMS